MAVVKINALEFPDGEGPELERRFAARRNAMNDVPGCIGFQLWRPVAGEKRYFVTTQWESDEAYRAWRNQGMGPSHTGGGQKQVSTGASQIEFEVVDLEARAAEL